VDVLTRRDSSKPPEVVDWKDGVRVIHVTAGPARHIKKEELLPYMEDFRVQCLRLIRQGSAYDLIHANFWMSGLVAAEIKEETGIPFVVTFHALGKVRRLFQGDADLFPDDRFAVEDRIVREADGIIAECPQDLEDLIEHYQADAAKIRIIPCGFDPSEFWPIDRFLARRQLSLPKEEFIVLQLGRLVPRKGIDTVISAFSRFLRQQPIPSRLLVVGGDSPTGHNGREDSETARLRQITSAEGIVDKVFFLGQRSRERLRYYYNSADVFVTTPWYEPFGITPLEGMACGLPVIGSRVGGIKYSVVDGETGYLIPPRDPDALADTLLRLSSEPTLRDTLGRNGLRRVSEGFTWQKVTRSIAELYEEVLMGCGPHLASLKTRLETLDREFEGIHDAVDRSRRVLGPVVVEAADQITRAFRVGGKVLVCGNGGSAADAQHFAGELVGRFRHRSRPGLPALALTADSSVITAWSNDMGYENVFARQVEAFGRQGDVLLCISTSGESSNLIRACARAHEAGFSCIALVGNGGGELAKIADRAIIVPSRDQQRIQEMQLCVLHLLCRLVEDEIVRDGLAKGSEENSVDPQLSF